mgnify:CR=1 FL=1
MKKILIAGTNSGVGKTTISLGIMQALTKRNLNVQPFKVGPDYIDPSYHTFITGRYSRNLDSYMLDDEKIKYVFNDASKDADISVVEGVMGGTLPWVLIFMGVFIAIVVEILGIPVLAFSIGLYLPIYLSTPIMVGGLIRWFIDNKRKYDSDAARKDGSDRGVLYAAGMIAGEGIVGILLAVLAVFGVADKINLSSVYGAAFQSVGNWVGLAAFVVLLAILFYFTRNKKTIEVDAEK